MKIYVVSLFHRATINDKVGQTAHLYKKSHFKRLTLGALKLK